MRIVPIFCLVLVVQSVPILDTRGDYVKNKDSDVEELNYATLKDDVGGPLPDHFTICSSNFLANKVARNVWVDVLKEDFSHWFFIYQNIKNVKKGTEEIKHSLWINVNGAYSYLSDFGPLH